MSEDKKANWAKLGTIQTAKDNPDRLFISVNHYKGTLLFQEKGTNKVYKINSITIREPFENDPQFVQKVLSVNLDNPKSVELLDDEAQTEPAAR